MEELARFAKVGDNKEFTAEMVLNDKKRRKLETELPKKYQKDSEYSDAEIDLLRSYVKEWKDMYTLEEIQSCVDKITTISYSQYIDIYGSFKAVAVSSGYCLGSANWILESDFKKIVYISN